MSVLLKEYCETSQSKFAEALRVALDYVVFIGDDIVNFADDGAKVKATIKIPYSLTVFDVQRLLRAFSGFYWAIEPITSGCGYQIVAYLKSNMI